MAKPKTQPEEVEPEIMDPVDDRRSRGIAAQIALLSEGGQLAKMEGAHQTVLSLLRPRKEDKVLELALEELNRKKDIEEEEYWYSIAFKEHAEDCRNQRNCDCPEKIAESGGIRTAEILIRRWGNCSVKVEEAGDDGEYITRTISGIDYETGFSFSVPVKTAKKIRRRNGEIWPLSDSFLEKALAANTAKGYRNVSKKLIPEYMFEAMVDRAKELWLAGEKERNKTIEARVAKMVTEFGKYKVTVADLEAFLKHPMAQTTDADLQKLRGIFAAIRKESLDPLVALGLKTDQDQPAPSTPQTSAQTSAPAASAVVAAAGVTGASSTAGGKAPREVAQNPLDF